MKLIFHPRIYLWTCQWSLLCFFLDVIALQLSITCKINCFLRAVEIDHLMMEADLTQAYVGAFGPWFASCGLSALTSNFIKCLCGWYFSEINKLSIWTSDRAWEINYEPWALSTALKGVHSHGRWDEGVQDLRSLEIHLTSLRLTNSSSTRLLLECL